MAERFKLKLSRVIPSLQICGQKDPSASVHTPVPAGFRLSPVNSKVYDISYPNNNPPAPPPTTPEGHFIKRHVSTKVLLCFSSEEDESEALISSSTSSLSNNSSTEIEHSPEIRRESDNGRKKKKVNTNIRQIRRQRRKASMDCKQSDTTVAGAVSPVKTSVFRRTIPSTVDGKVRESVAVVKESVDPREDFKMSMLEMILQKQMFEVKDLEQLLFCFLSLNSKTHHEIIVDAFSDIWEIMFCDGTR